MPRYYFDLHDGFSERDDDGTELNDVAHARQEALRFAGKIIHDEARKSGYYPEWRLDVSDERRTLLFRLDFMMTRAPLPTG